MIQSEKEQTGDVDNPEIFMTLRNSNDAPAGLIALIRRDAEDDDEEPVDNSQE